MRTFDSILPDVLPRLPGVPEPTIERELLRAAQVICRRSRCWTVWTDPVQLQPGVTEYELDVPDGGQVVRVEAMTLDGRPAKVLPWQWLEHSETDLIGAEVVTAGRMAFFTGPNASGQVRFKAVLMPGENSPGLPDMVFDGNEAALVDGVIARCAAIAGQSFTAPDLAAVHGAAFDKAVSALALREFRGGTNGTPRQHVRWC